MIDEIPVLLTVFVQIGEQSVEENAVAARPEREVNIRDGSCLCFPGIDDHDFQCRVALFCRGDSLEEYRMTPGGIAACQHDEIGELQVFIGARYRILAECTLVSGNRRRHAEPRIGIDIRRSDKALHELVGDIVVFGEQLAGDVESDRFRAVFIDNATQRASDGADGLFPADLLAMNLGIEQTVLQVDGFAEGRSLRAEPSVIGRMFRVALDGNDAFIVDRGQYAAADTAVGTGGFYFRLHAGY